MSLARLRTAFKILPVALAVTAASLTLAACGSIESTPTGAGASSAGAFPVTIEHKFGKTDVTKQAERVVTLGLSDHETVLALGIKPVGVVDWFKEDPFGKWPWEQPAWGGAKPEIVGERDEYNVEKIAALKPDLILAQYSGMKKEQYETLSRIAPVVAQSGKNEDYATPWKDMARTIGAALGQAAKADELIAGIDKRFADVRAAHPDFAKQTVIVAESYEPGAYSAFSPTDPKTLFLTGLGFKPSQKLGELAGGKSFADLSGEQLELLDVDRLVWLADDVSVEARVKADPIYSKLKVAKEGRALFLSYTDPPIGGAISFNTVLSIPYALDQLVPLLAAKTG